LISCSRLAALNAMSTTPDRPPQSVAGTDNPFAGWDDVPLFMKSLPAEQGGQRKQDAPDDNATLDALAALMYEGTATGTSSHASDHGLS
jgi:hypothetical protein